MHRTEQSGLLGAHDTPKLKSDSHHPGHRLTVRWLSAPRPDDNHADEPHNEVLEGSDPIELKPGEYWIGRETGGPLCWTRDRWLSKRHALLRVSGQPLRAELLDNNSTNRTRLNGEHLAPSQWVRLPEQAVLWIANSFLLVRTDQEYGADWSKAASVPALDTLVGISPEMQILRQEIYRLSQTRQSSRTPIPILILGETGTGKELTAKAIHQLSDRAKQRCLEVNCAAIPKELAVSMLFGSKKGAFTGAHTNLSGYFRDADHGTLFLDELAELDSTVQAMLLRVIEEGKVMPLGGSEQIPVDVRLIAATNSDIEERTHQVKQKNAPEQFRQDLLARLRRGVLRTPALRHRREDILPLLRHYWLSAFGCELPPLAPALVNALLLSDFRENVRGLQSIAIDLHATAMRQGLQNRLELHAVRERLSEQRRGIEERGNPISAHKRSDLASPARTECGDIRNPSDLRRFAEQYMALGTAYAVGKHFGWDDNKVARWKKECQRHGLLPKASL